MLGNHAAGGSDHAAVTCLQGTARGGHSSDLRPVQNYRCACLLSPKLRSEWTLQTTPSLPTLCRLAESSCVTYLYMRESLSLLTPQRSLQRSLCQRVIPYYVLLKLSQLCDLHRSCIAVHEVVSVEMHPKPCQQAQANCTSFVTAHAAILLLQRTQLLLQRLIAMRTYCMASFMRMALGIWPE